MLGRLTPLYGHSFNQADGGGVFSKADLQAECVKLEQRNEGVWKYMPDESIKVEALVNHADPNTMSSQTARTIVEAYDDLIVSNTSKHTPQTH